MMKKLTAIFLSLVLMGTFVSTGLAEEGSVSGTEPDQMVQTVIDLGLFEGDETGDYQLDSQLTRAEFAKLLYHVLNYGQGEPASRSYSTFVDVEVWHWAAGYIGFLYDIGLVSGVGENRFAPEEPVTANQVYKMLLDCAGYTELAGYSGGYPQGYVQLAARTGLSDGAKAAGEEPISRLDAAHILYQLLSIDVLSVTGKQDDALQLDSGSRFSEEVMNLYRISGIVEADDIIALDGAPVKEGWIRIGTAEYETGGTRYTDLVGMRVDGYYFRDVNEERAELVYLRQSDRTRVLTLRDDEIISYKDGIYEYWPDASGASQARRVELGRNAVVIYNYALTGDADLYSPREGTVRLINNEDGLGWSVAIVQDYTTFEVEEIDKNSQTLTADAAGAEEAFSFSFLNRSEYEIVSTEGDLMDFDGISKGAVVSLLFHPDEPDGYVKCIVSQATAEGIVTRLTTQEDMRNIEIDGTLYEVQKNSPLDTSDSLPAVGQSVAIKLDYEGKAFSQGISAVNAENSYYRYGYLIHLAQDSDMDQTVYIKILDQDGSINVLPCDQDLKINGEKVGMERALQLFLWEGNPDVALRQAIRYHVTAGTIREIQTEKQITEGVNNDLLLRASGRLYFYKGAVNGFKKIQPVDEADKLSSEVMLSAAPVVFSVPPKTSPKNYEDSAFRVVSLSEVVYEDKPCWLDAYNTSADTLESDLVVIYKENGAFFDQNQPFVMVEEITQIYDEALGSAAVQLVGTTGGNTVTYTAEDAGTFSISGYTVSEGDLIRVVNNETGYAERIELLYSPHTDSGFLSSSGYYPAGAVRNAVYRFIRGRVEQISGDILSVYYENGTGDQNREYHRINGKPVYIYDASSNAETRISQGTAEDITEGCEVFIQTSYAAVQQIFVYKP